MQFDGIILPDLREDLELIPAELNSAGEQTFVIRDIRQNRYVRIGADTFRILLHWENGLSLSDFHWKLHSEGVFLSSDELVACIDKLRNAGLLEVDPKTLTERILAKNKSTKWRYFDKVLHSYLFFKIPIFYPDRFINRTLSFTEVFYTRNFYIFSISLGMCGIFFLLPQIDRLKTSLSVTGNFEMGVKFLIALVIGKFMHELGHAYAAARKGCHIGSIGVGFIVGAPVFYSDVTDTWRLSNKNERILVSASGIIVEFLLAIYALNLWLLNINPFINDVALYLGLATWTNTLFFNANPLMKFDGYYIFSDYINIKNLQAKAFVETSELFRWIVFGLPRSNGRPKNVILIFGICSAIYRFTIIAGVAYILYHFSFRLIAILLFCVEIWFFLLLPIWRNCKIVWNNRQNIAPWRAELGILSALIVVISFLLMPISITVSAAAIATREHVTRVYEHHASEAAMIIDDLPKSLNDGELLFTSKNKFTDIDYSIAKSELEMLKLRYNRIITAPSERDIIPILAAEMQRAMAKTRYFREQINDMNILAQSEGVFLPIASLQLGRAIAKNTFLGTYVSGKNKIIAYIAEKDLFRIKEGLSVIFIQGFNIKNYKGRILTVEKSSIDRIPYPGLASVYGGPIKSHGTAQSGLYSEEALYRAIIDVENTEGILSLQSGIAIIEVESISIWNSFSGYLGSLIRRESHVD